MRNEVQEISNIYQKRGDCMKKLKRALTGLLLVFVLFSTLLSGCIDEDMFSEAYLESFEEDMEALSARVDAFTAGLTEPRQAVFAARLEQSMEGLTENLFVSMEQLTEGLSEEEIEALDESIFEAVFDVLLQEMTLAIDRLIAEFEQFTTAIVLVIDQAAAQVDGFTYQLDQAPMIRDGRTMVPLRFIGEALGADIEWNDANRSVTYTKGQQAVVLTIDQPFALVNGIQTGLDTAPVIANGRTLVPLRFISEALGYTIHWEGISRTVTILGSDPVMEVPQVTDSALGVVTAYNETAVSVTMLIDGMPVTYPVESSLFTDIVESWDHYSHWGLYEAGLDPDGRLISLEYGEGVADIIGIFADYYTERTLADVLSADGTTVTLIGVEYLLDSDDPDDLPGFSTEINSNLTPANNETIELSANVQIYVEGEDGLFTVGSLSQIDGDSYDYIEFYDINGDLVYDIVIIWLI
jgi:hypothetical protein